MSGNSSIERVKWNILDCKEYIRSIFDEGFKPAHILLRLISERIINAARNCGLTKNALCDVFQNFTIIEFSSQVVIDRENYNYYLAEASHAVQGKVGKGALKVILPDDLVEESEVEKFKKTGDDLIEVLPPFGEQRWNSRDEAWIAIRDFLREWVVGETLSMSLKSQATGTPFSGSEGVILCANEIFDASSGRFFLRNVLSKDEKLRDRDKEIVESIINDASEILTEAGRIAHNSIVHAAETNSTLTAKLNLQLPTNVVEGHLRSLLTADSELVIGDEDMSRQLRKILRDSGYKSTNCMLAKESARMQMEHSIISLGSREKLRQLLDSLPADGFPTSEQFREIMDIFFGAGEIQQTEDQIYHHRFSILKCLAKVFSTSSIEECDELCILTLFIRTLVDNQEKMMKIPLLRGFGNNEVLSPDWFQKYPLLTQEQENELLALLPSRGNSASEVRDRFSRLRKTLIRIREEILLESESVYRAAKLEVIELAVGALCARSRIVPPVDRIRFFTLPFTYECVTPKLGVVTRKPVEICGSVLRPVAMASGAVIAISTYLQRFSGVRENLFERLKVAVQGLGNAGKGVVKILSSRGATIIALSDSTGALISLGGFSEAELESIIAHKNSGKRLNTWEIPEPSRKSGAIVFHSNPDVILELKLDLIILTAKPASINSSNVHHIRAKIVCELTGAAVTFEARNYLFKRQIDVIPDNIASSGGMLVSLLEMLQNTSGQQWDAGLEESILNDQIVKSYQDVCRIAEQYKTDLGTASDILSLGRLNEIYVYSQHLNTAANILRRHLNEIEKDEVIIVASDNDEDGVASSAILHGIVANLNPGREKQLMHIVASTRSRVVINTAEELLKRGKIVKKVFFLDRAFPLSESYQTIVQELAERYTVIIINNHKIPDELIGCAHNNSVGDRKRITGIKTPDEIGVILISPQTLRAPTPSKLFSTSLLLNELAHTIIKDVKALYLMDWNAVIGSCLDVRLESNYDWSLFYAQFNPDQMIEFARAIRLVARARSFHTAIDALLGIERPDQLETNKAWEDFMNLYRALAKRVQLLVEIIIMENIGKPYISHFFTDAELEPPEKSTEDPGENLDLYHWISELLIKRPDIAEKPIIVGQVIHPRFEEPYLGMRIRSPRGVDLMEAGLPDNFVSGGLPNTAVARFPINKFVNPSIQFKEIVENIWWRVVSPTVRLKTFYSK